MTDPIEVEQLRAQRLDPATSSIQRKLIRTLVWGSVALIVVGQCMAWRSGEHVEGPGDVARTLRALPSGRSLMLLGLMVGLATPVARSMLLAGWFARRGERAMALIALAVVAIVLSGLLLRH
ncbi:MAG: DUF1634 domain-containing protein [Phycisphaerales bacterium]|jgi:hypothetical protein